ncbi:hypothetical protein Tco_0926546 [Tanacetum coccineum]|uniref:Uncharacterized protein n=1 Tax=Tanacetum coccineum TaxID=301880 RepID=A0ABQ5DB89_9ASTR
MDLPMDIPLDSVEVLRFLDDAQVRASKDFRYSDTTLNYNYLRKVPMEPNGNPQQESCQFPQEQLISWQCNKTIIVASVYSPKQEYVRDETVYEERGDRLEKATTMLASLESEQDMVTKIKEQIPLLGDRPAQTRFERRIHPKQKRDEIDQMKGFMLSRDTNTQGSAPITTAGVSVSTADPSTPPITTTLIVNEDLTIAQTLMKMRSVKSKEKSKEKEVTVDTDRQLAEQLQAQKREELIGKEQSKFLAVLIETRRKYFASKRAKENRNKPPIKAQQRNLMCTYLKNMEGYKHNDLRAKGSMEGSKKKARSSEVSKKKAGEKHNEESVKRQKLVDDAKKEELKLCLEIVPNDGKAIHIEPLATKSLIVD